MLTAVPRSLDLSVVALTAFAMPARSYVGVLRRVLMPAIAVCSCRCGNTRVTARADSVLDVLLLGSPVEIVETVVLRVVIPVAAVHTFRPRSYECFKDKGVDHDWSAPPVSVEDAPVIAASRLTSADLGLL